MTFNKKITKLGSGKNVNCFAKNDGTLDIYFFNSNAVNKKTLSLGSSVMVQTSKEKFEVSEVVPLDESLKIGRIDNNIFLI